MNTKKFTIFIATGMIFLVAKTTLAEVDSSEFKVALQSSNVCQQVFTTIPKVFTATTTTVSTNSAQLGGVVNPNNGPTKYWFEYGLTKNLNESTGFIYAGKDNNDISVVITDSDLQSNKIYFYRLVAENQKGKTEGEIKYFQTLNN